MTTSTDTHKITEHLPALDILRGLAILGVVWHHYGSEAFPSGWWLSSLGLQGFIGTWATNAWMGVNLFFILSGFVLYWPFVTGQRALTTKSEIGAFYIRRAKRLLPLYYFSVLVLVGFVAVPSLLGSLAMLTITFNFSKQTFFPGVNWVLWSLGLEVWFSLIFPLLVFGINRLKIYKITVAILVVSLLVRYVGVYFPGFAYEGNPFINPVKDSILARLDDFMVGMVLAHLYAQGYRMSRPRLMALLGAAVITAAAVFTDFTVLNDQLHWAIIFTNSLFQVGAGLVILATLSLKGFRFYLLELMGLMCYSLYVWHGVLLNHIKPQHHTDSKFQYVIIISGLVWLSYRYIEFGHVKDFRQLLPRKRVSSEPRG